ncbi:MAG: sulfotransferase domain-containing protein, partial [Gammaproteobacteria bacterium]|nr:sulfotransferase domain-containing protein [Gammaproteobacteria bacterium]
MRTAFLILAHHQPELLARLVRNISADWNDVYIHIDRTSEIEDFVACVDKDDGPVFLKEEQRIDYSWCGFSSVEAILSLLSAAFDSGHHYDRFCLLSGADFPIKPIHEIKSAFSCDIEFMRIDRRLSADKVNSHTKVVSRYHFIDQKSTPGIPESGVIEREVYSDIDLYHGSTWWALSYECIGYVIDYLQNHPEYIEFHKYTFCPDEVFFHSIVKSSPFAGQLSHEFDKEPDLEKYYRLNEHGCHYIDWNSPAETHPKILTPEDACALSHSDMLFARKFDENISHQLLAMLEQANSDEGVNKQGKQANNEIVEKVWVIGDGRSGTTWLSDLINYDTQYHFIFEPVHPQRRREMRGYDLFKYLRHEQKDEKLEQFCNQVFNGKVFTHDSAVPARFPMCPDKILVKDIFAHLMAKWVLNQNPEVKLVVLLRHPFSVALSKEKL